VTVFKAGERADSLRAYVSAVEVPHLLAVGGVPGVVPTAAGGKNGPGTGKLRSTLDGTWLSWRAPGSSTFGEAIRCSSDASYVIEDGDDAQKFLRVTVYTSYLIGPGEADVLLKEAFNTLGPDDVPAAEASAGAVETVQVDLTNDHTSNHARDVKVWLDAASVDLEISDDNITFVTPTTEGHGDVLTFAAIASGASVPIYVRRTISASASSDTNVLNLLQWAWDGH